MDRGDLVPDDVTIDMVRNRLRGGDAVSGFLLDGFPRTVPQGRVLDDLLRETSDAKLDVVLELVVDVDEVIRRLSGRRTCRTCNHVWHVDFDPPRRTASATRRRRALPARRRQAETIANRLTVYAESTARAVSYYAGRGCWSASTPPGRSTT
jgi:adenylate kinase